MFKSLKANLNGFIGETLFNTVSWLGLGKDYKIFKNIVIEAFDGTTQIDQIIVSKYGIFVIEVKTYKGWIFGNERNSKWTQVLYKQKNTFKILCDKITNI